MNELNTQARQLPDNLEDLSKFVLVGREKLNAVRAEIRAIERVQLAAEVHEQKLEEAQEIAEAVLDAEAKLGELTSKMEKATANQYTVQKDSGVSKQKQLEQIGITEKQKQRFEQLASHPEQVEQAKADARASGRIVTRQDVLNRIAPPKTRNQSMQEFKQQAREEHEEFKKSVSDGIVSIEKIKDDKDNLEVIALDIETTVRKAFASVNTIGFLKSSELDIMIDSLKQSERSEMVSMARNGIRVLTHLCRVLSERRTK